MNPNVPRWIQEMRIKDLLGHPYPWSRQSDVEKLHRQADIHMDRHLGHFSDAGWCRHHHHQPDWEGVVERFLPRGRPQGLANGPRDVGDMWNSFRRGSAGGGGGSRTGYRESNDSFADMDWTYQFYSNEPAGGYDPITEWERQVFHHPGPAGRHDPIIEWERQFFHTTALAGGNDVHPDLNWERQFHSQQRVGGDDIQPVLDWERQFHGHQLANGNDMGANIDWGLHGFERPGNDRHGADPFDEWFAGLNSGPGFHDHQPQGIDDIFGGREPRPYGLLEDQLYGDDRIFVDCESRPYAFHHDQLVHRNDDIYGDPNSRRDGLHNYQRAIEWHDDALGGIDDIFGRPWDMGSDDLLLN
jgi:hypothetical protein